MSGGDEVRAPYLLLAAALTIVCGGLCAGYLRHWPR
jgi:hypothetical protein